MDFLKHRSCDVDHIQVSRCFPILENFILWNIWRNNTQTRNHRRIQTGLWGSSCGPVPGGREHPGQRHSHRPGPFSAGFGSSSGIWGSAGYFLEMLKVWVVLSADEMVQDKLWVGGPGPTSCFHWHVSHILTCWRLVLHQKLMFWVFLTR